MMEISDVLSRAIDLRNRPDLRALPDLRGRPYLPDGPEDLAANRLSALALHGTRP